MNFINTPLWQCAFGRRKNDKHEAQRARLESALLSMRAEVSSLVSYIPADCKDLTIHDITHLDALWDSAQSIAGERWELNPAEAFVFGAAILTHDAGLTTLAYPNGRKGLEATSKWKQISLALQREAEFNPSVSKAKQFDRKLEDSIVFAVLRELHAEQAERLCTQAWELPDGKQLYLLDDKELREAYGECIGRIAHSHHWDIERVVTDLDGHIGGSPTLPIEWTINEVKIACLLRCADAAQVDRTRAPSLLYSAVSPKGYSNLHWKAQNKLNRPVLKEDGIIFSSSSQFKPSEAEAWWIAFDLARILDKELRSANAVLTEIGHVTFSAQRVAGGDSARAFSRYVKTDGWKPIDATVHVSDPLRLARSLGGKNLYGNNPIVPFRELVQNAADAIRARRILEHRSEQFGRIAITIEQCPSSPDNALVHIDDNGVGMSERVLCGTLLDFGKSLWSSAALREEFPNLRANSLKPIGKFGIGFFSVFELSDDVRVITRRYDEGPKDARTLEFRSLVTRPLLRDASPGELPPDISTRVTLCVTKRNIAGIGTPLPPSQFEMFASGHRVRFSNLRDRLQNMASFLDIEVQFVDKFTGSNFFHTPDIYKKTAAEFLRELTGNPQSKQWSAYLQDAADRLRPISLPDGQPIGRAALDIRQILAPSSDSLQASAISIGGLASLEYSRGWRTENNYSIPYIGIIEGNTSRAARDHSETSIPDASTTAWLIEQVSLIDRRLFRTSELMRISAFVTPILGINQDLPYAFHKGKCRNLKYICDVIGKSNRISIPAAWKYDAWVELLGYNDLYPDFFQVSLEREIIALAGGSRRLIEEDDARELRKTNGGIFDLEKLKSSWDDGNHFVELLTNYWGTTPVVKLETSNIFSTKIPSLGSRKWVLSFIKEIEQ